MVANNEFNKEFDAGLRVPHGSIVETINPNVETLAGALSALAEVCRLVDEPSRALLVRSVAAALLPVVSVTPEPERVRA